MADDPTKELPDDERWHEMTSLLYALQKEVARLTSKIDNLDAKFSNLDAKVDARLHDTRPMWESVNAHMQETNGRLEKIERDMSLLNRSFNKLAGDVLRVHSQQEDVDERVSRLEEKAS